MIRLCVAAGAAAALSLSAAVGSAAAQEVPATCQPDDVSVTMTTSAPGSGALIITPSRSARSCLIDGYLTDISFLDGGYRRLATRIGPPENSTPPRRELLQPGSVIWVNLRWPTGNQGAPDVIDPQHLELRLPGAAAKSAALWLGGPVLGGGLRLSAPYSAS